jgi:hypothetical protein
MNIFRNIQFVVFLTKASFYVPIEAKPAEPVLIKHISF